ncbi:50S ribosomal protein L15 [Cellulomonas sp. APG4]|uniref:50S ribosomal protein L15 n=1 Tax=Cellulomonas sp. APG4 TaxID=1538656 RepID=UPI00137955C5|nr:50S ribosomal protein L15 [Cellulomonas sp. APG4]NCT89671.1 50S ribosomal protein L15 [Cellulomonas sp. APG4]
MAESKKKDEAAASTEKKAPATSGAKATAAEKKPATKTAAAKKPAAKAAAEKPATTKAAAEKKPASKASSSAAEKPASAKATSAAAAARAAAKAEGAGGTLKLHHLRPAPGAHTAKTRVGRGEASKGKTAGRGTKGTKARYQVPERFEGGQMPMHMRLPKLRGFKNPFRTEYQVVNLDTLAALYPQGGDVTVEDLVSKGAVRKGSPVKVLGNGDVGVKLTVAVQKVSASAREKILAAGGTIQD